MPRPGSHKYDAERAHERQRLEDTGEATDQRADEEANRRLQEDPLRRPVRYTDRAAGPKSERPHAPRAAADRGGIELRSSAFNDHAPLPARFAQDADGTSPPLEWSPAPTGTTELVITCVDLDGPDGPTVHCLVSGIDPRTSGVAEGELTGVGRPWPNAWGEAWSGPRPPVGDEAHRYRFRLYAVDGPLELPETPGAADVDHAAAARELAHGDLVGLFVR